MTGGVNNGGERYTYQLESSLKATEFIGLLERSGLAARRPVDDSACITGMLDNSNLVVTARHNGLLIGVARSVTDFHFCCYLSDLAVDRTYQGLGIGRHLQQTTLDHLADTCTIILLAAPDADMYYGHVGYQRHSRCWVIDSNKKIIV
ncbi:GNAT family N-acetyltransferase [Porticoccus sp. GXU_MW_L64]